MTGQSNQANADTVQNVQRNSQNASQTYIVQQGDTLSAIASKFNTTIDNLAQLNHLTNVNLLSIGEKLQITPMNFGAHQATQYQWIPDTSAKVNVPVKQAVSTPQVAKTAPSVATSHVSSAATPVKQTVNYNHAANHATPMNQNVQTNNAQNVNTQNNDNLSGSEQAAKNYVVQHESGGNYNARNGQYIGKYQLSASYLHGDYSPANQDRVANQYVAQRYGNWENAAAHESSYGWY